MTVKQYLFGEIAVEKGFVTLAQVSQALTEQAVRGGQEPVGAVMVDLGHISEEDRMGVLQEQIRRLADEGNSLFGQVAVERGFVTREGLEQAIRDQASLRDAGRHQPLGELLIENGSLLPHQAEHILEFQRFRRSIPGQG